MRTLQHDLQPRSRQDPCRNRAHRKNRGFLLRPDGPQSLPAFDDGFVGLSDAIYIYAAILWTMENHSEPIDIMRELMGGGQFQFPASIDVLEGADGGSP